MLQSDKGVVFVWFSLSNLAIHCLTQADLPEGSNLRYDIPESFLKCPGGRESARGKLAPNNMEKYFIHTASTEKNPTITFHNKL